MIRIILISFLTAILTSCPSKKSDQVIWVYTSIYKDTISDIKAQLEKKFPDIKVQFYQAGSEEVAAKVQAELTTGKIQADILISSDRFWYEELATQKKLLSYKPVNSEKVDNVYKHPEFFYSAVSFPVMLLAYNNEAITDKEAPQSFKELAQSKWKDKVSMGSPLASGTSFTTVTFLTDKYGWDFMSDLRKNNIIAEGGNSGVIRRLQSKERPVGIVLLENVLRLTQSDPRIKFVVPNDGAIIQSNILALVKKEESREAAQKIADWFFSEEGQEALRKSFMYPSVSLKAVDGGPLFSEISKNSKSWSREFIETTLKNREKIKDQFSKIIF